MALRKEEGADLRKRYPIFVEVGMITALLILILAFRFTWDSGPTKTFDMTEQETVEVKEVQQTQQQKTPPPPPRPPVPIEKPDDQVLEDESLDFDATLDFDQPLQEQPQQEAPPAPDEPEEEEEVVPFAVIEDQPELIGDPLEARVEYPRFAQRANIEGTVFLQFVVDKQGGVKDIEVLRSPNDALSEEAVRALSEAKFTPGRQRKQPVEVRMSLPVRFQLR